MTPAAEPVAPGCGVPHRLEGRMVARVAEDVAPTIAAIVPAGEPVTLRLESSGVSELRLLIDMESGASIVIEGDVGLRPLRIHARGPSDAFHVHLRGLAAGGLGYHLAPKQAHVHLEAGLVMRRATAGGGTCIGMCSGDAACRAELCEPAELVGCERCGSLWWDDEPLPCG